MAFVSPRLSEDGRGSRVLQEQWSQRHPVVLVSHSRGHVIVREICILMCYTKCSLYDTRFVTVMGTVFAVISGERFAGESPYLLCKLGLVSPECCLLLCCLAAAAAQGSCRAMLSHAVFLSVCLFVYTALAEAAQACIE